MKKNIMLITPILLLVGCNTAKLNDSIVALNTVNALLAPNAVNKSQNNFSSRSGSSVVNQNVVKVMVIPRSDKQVSAKIHSAKPFITRMLSEASCLKSIGEGNKMGKYLAPDGGLNRFTIPAIGMSYHQRGTCLQVKRVDGWKSPSKNSLKFRALFVSPSSGETANRYYTIVRQPDNQWLAKF